MSSRREFIKKIAWGLPASYALPAYFLSCQKEESSLFPTKAYEGRVAVIGAGIAGLHAASTLRKHGVNARLYEADDQIGGRIKTQALGTPNDLSDNNLLVPHPIELGAEFVYGIHNPFYDLLRNFTTAIDQLPEMPRYFINNRLLDLPTLSQNNIYARYLQVIEQIRTSQGEDQTIEDHVFKLRAQEEQNLSKPSDIDGLRTSYAQTNVIIDSTISAEHGILSRDLGIKEYQQKQSIRDHDPNIYRLSEDPLFHALRSIYQESLTDIAYNSQITAINYSESEVQIHIKDKKEPIIVDKVILTTPVSTIRNISFTPELPQPKQEALSNIKMSSAVKVFMLFRRKFWGESISKVFLPYPYSFLLPHPNPDLAILTLYAYGSEAESLASLGADIIPLTRDLLDTVFGQKSASTNLQDFRTFHWTTTRSESPFIPGAYSYVEEGFLDARAQLAEPLDNKIYFAGEATHTHGLAATVQGALETGTRAAHELLSNV